MFKVYSNIIPSELIDKVVEEHEKFKYSKTSLFRAQGTNSFEFPKIDKFGNQLNSIQNPDILGFSRSFRKSIIEIIFHRKISDSLSDFTGSKKHVQYQSMFFDHSTGTKLHQDTWYLDTKERGRLVGAWIALEDIYASSGPFCIYRGADKQVLNDEDYDFDNLDEDLSFKTDYPEANRYDFIAKKGDVLIWDSFSIHGSLEPPSTNITRKSITAHFYPFGLPVRDQIVSRAYSIYQHDKPIRTTNPRIYKAATVNPYVYSFLCLFLYIFKPISKFLMRDILMRKKSKNRLEIRRIK